MSDTTPLLGIDLGHATTSMALIARDGPPVPVANADGDTAPPSSIWFYDDEGVLVGAEAQSNALLEPEQVVTGFKAHLGNPDWSWTHGGRSFTATELVGLLLRQLREDAESLHGSAVTDAVVAVPHDFTSAQRRAVVEAGTIAGLRVLSVLNEPMAAAMGYGLGRLGQDGTFVVVDVGHHGTSASVLTVEGKRLATLATHADQELGGHALLARLRDFVLDRYRYAHSGNPTPTPEAKQILQDRLALALSTLSAHDEVTLPVGQGASRAMVTVSRTAFEHEIDNLLRRMKRVVRFALAKAGRRTQDVDDVLMVGAPARMPAVRRSVAAALGREPVALEEVDPNLAVALGAALGGALRHRPALNVQPPGRPRAALRASPAAPTAEPDVRPDVASLGLADGGHQALHTAAPSLTAQDVELSASTTRALGIVVLDQERNERVIELIPEDTPLPAEFRARFVYAYDGMTAVRVEVTEGSGASRDDVQVIGQVELQGLPPRPKGTPIEVIYAYDLDQVLSVKVVDPTLGRWADAQLSFTGGMGAEDLSKAADRAAALLGAASTTAARQEQPPAGDAR